MLKRLRKIVRIKTLGCLISIDFLRTQAQNLFFGYGSVIICYPSNPCPSCDVAISKSIYELYRKGWLVIGESMLNEKGDCCSMTGSLMRSVEQVKPLRW